MMLFPKALFLASTFPKIVKKSIFLLNSDQKFLTNFPTIRALRQTSERLTQAL